MLTRSGYRDIVRRLVGDPLTEKDPRYTDGHIDDALEAALDAIGEYRGRMEVKALTSEDEEAVFLQLPNDLLRIRRASTDYESSSQWIGKLVTFKGDAVNDSADAYLVYDDQLYYPPGLASDQSITIHYEARWSWPELDNQDPDFPGWFRRAVPYYAAHYLLMNFVSRFSVDTFWKTRQDANISNPAVDGADWFLRQFKMVCQANVDDEVVE